MSRNEFTSSTPATANFTEYITKEGDRWDLIAYKFYADASLYEKIIQSNPAVEITPILKSGIRLKIPILNQDSQIQFELPPWRC
jgi:phage tail protein X